MWPALYGPEPEATPAYAPDWAEATAAESLAEAARRHMIEIAPADFAPGDLLLFRWRNGVSAKHAAIATAPDLMVHARDGAAVAEVAIAPGDAFIVTAGCDKLFATCRDRFANVVNFRGFPHIPGNDFVTSYPSPGKPGNDGGSLQKDAAG